MHTTDAALPTLADIEAAAQVVYREFPPTPQYRWALLSERLGTDCWVKHENHTPVGAFKIRGGLTYFDQLARSGSLPAEVISDLGSSTGVDARKATNWIAAMESQISAVGGGGASDYQLATGIGDLAIGDSGSLPGRGRS